MISRYLDGAFYAAHRDNVCDEGVEDTPEMRIAELRGLAAEKRSRGDHAGAVALCERIMQIEHKRDRFRPNQRWLTILLYLNSKDWQDAWGGHLRLHPCAPCSQKTVSEQPAEGRHVDIAPCGGRLVCFLARDMLHEVRPAHQERLAVSLWINAVPK